MLTDFNGSSSFHASCSGSTAFRRRESRIPRLVPFWLMNLYVYLIELAKSLISVGHKPSQERRHSLKSSHACDGIIIVLGHCPRELRFIGCGTVSQRSQLLDSLLLNDRYRIYVGQLSRINSWASKAFNRTRCDLQSVVPNIYTPNSPVAHSLIKGAI